MSELNAPVIGGNVSLYNETNGTAVYPTPVVGMVGLIKDIDHITTQSFKKAGDLIYLLGETKTSLAEVNCKNHQMAKFQGRLQKLILSVEDEASKGCS